MKVYRLEFIKQGLYYVLTEEELKQEYSEEEIIYFKRDDMVIFSETTYNKKQLVMARKLHNDIEYLEWYEDMFGCSPSLYEILQHYFG